VYDALRRSGDQNLFDLLITGTTVVNGLGITPFTADIGINYSFSQTESGPLITGASIADLGDMGESDGKQVIDGSKLVCIPGFIIYNNEMTPDKIPDFESCRRLLRSGVTTVIGTVSLHQMDEIEQISHLFERNTNAVNLGFIGSTMLFSRELSEKERDNLLYGIAQRMLGIDTSGLPESAKKYIEWFSIRTVSGIKQKVNLPVEQIAIADVPEVTYQMARQVGLTNRGTIRTGSVADLLLFEQDSIEKQMGTLDLKKLRYILLNGVMVYENGVFTNEFKGSILRR
jgi:N-acyl-D-aspartate/D-glutamate deacylase